MMKRKPISERHDYTLTPKATDAPGVHPRHSAQASSSVLHLIQPGEIGGAETVLGGLARAQKSHGASVAVAAIIHTDDTAKSFIAGLRDDGITTHRVLVKGRGYLQERRAISAICESMSPTVVHSHGYRSDVVDALHVRRHIPIVTTVHGYTGGGARNRLYGRIQRLAFRRFDAVVAVSAQLGQQLARTVRSERLHVLPNALEAVPALSRVEARTALGIPLDRFVAGWVGRMSKEKGADVMLAALADASAPASVHVAFVGDGPVLESLKMDAVRLGVDSRVSWLGRIANASRLFAAFDALVLSSRTEGTPMVILEAMAAGIPIIATRVGGVGDVLTAGTAFLVDPEAPAELARAMRLVCDDHEGALLLAHAARRRLEKEYSVDNWVAGYEGIYKRARDEASRRLVR